MVRFQSNASNVCAVLIGGVVGYHKEGVNFAFILEYSVCKNSYHKIDRHLGIMPANKMSFSFISYLYDDWISKYDAY